MSDGILRLRPLEVDRIRTLLCDADGCLFPSEEPAYDASTMVVNRVMERVGSPERYEPEELRRTALGRSFRSLVADLTADWAAMAEDELERWVQEERRAVTEHLRHSLDPDPEVEAPLRRLSERYALAVVSSSALSRLAACFEVTGLADLLPAARRYSAEDSLPQPTSKPDPAVYLHAVEELGLRAGEALAIEDSLTGVRSAVAAGLPTVANLQFVSALEREQRVAELDAAGACAVIGTWSGLETLLGE